MCSQTMTLSVPSEKLRKIKQDARRLLDQTAVSIREIIQFVGKTTATLRAIPLAPLHYWALRRMMSTVLPLNYSQEEITKKYNTTLTLTLASREDLSWWASLRQAPGGAPVCLLQPTHPTRAGGQYSMAS